MTDAEQRAAAREFAKYWKGKGYEKGQSQPFWLSLLGKVFGITNAEQFVRFEERVKLDNASFIDGWIAETHVMIEQKGIDKDLRKPIRQSDGTMLNPFQQAKRYAAELPYSERPRWIVTCNFKEFLVYDMENPNSEPESILLENLEKEYFRLSFLVDSGSIHLKREMELSIEAGEIVGQLYDEILKQYKDPGSEHSLKSLNMLCVRLVFCLYAEDAGVFGRKSMFHDYLAAFNADQMRSALIDLFKVLDTQEQDRDPYLSDGLAAFPYVNGGLFADTDIEIPNFTNEIRRILLERASSKFDWSEISPTIFGAVFESTLNPETRRSGGMHYTSIQNIHRVIDPLFLNELGTELTAIREIRVEKDRIVSLRGFRDRLAKLTFLDPACGSGNFLTETYLSLRHMENDILREISKGQGQLDLNDIIKVKIGQFYGIEINDFAVTVAKTALWIAESQMMKKTEDVVHRNLDFLPLKSYTNIVEGNALRIDWKSVVSADELKYIIGNPPFVGKKEQTRDQKADLMSLFGAQAKGVGNLDYVAGWYVKALNFIQNTEIRCAFVSTNSITQGEQVPILWRELLKLQIDVGFAYRTFRWDSEASLKAHVHCVIIGFSTGNAWSTGKRLFVNESQWVEVSNINPYLVDAPTVLIDSRRRSICDVPAIMYGSMPIDDGHLVLEAEDLEVLLNEDSRNARFVRKYAGGEELLHNVDRWCLWLTDASPNELKASPFIYRRILATQEFRRSSGRPQTLQLAEVPYLFGEIRQPNISMLVIPKVSSEKRRYIPIVFVPPTTIISGSALIVPGATLFSFGILTSNVHNAWMRAVCGRLETRYQYSGSVVYNNFPWCAPTLEHKAKIEATAQAILDARAQYPECTLADLYDEAMMRPGLRKAHQANDLAVMAAYGFSPKITESECVAKLMTLFQTLTSS